MQSDAAHIPKSGEKRNRKFQIQKGTQKVPQKGLF